MSNASTKPIQSTKRSNLRLVAGRIEIQFDWHQDRWAHRIQIDGQPIWESLEGPLATLAPEISDHWPASPVFSEILSTETTRGPALLGIGLAGKSHFSASVTAPPDTPDTLLVEVACRLHEPPGWLGSAYRRLAAALASSDEKSLISICPTSVKTGKLPFTSSWSYQIGPAGPVAVPPASCERLLDRSN